MVLNFFKKNEEVPDVGKEEEYEEKKKKKLFSFKPKDQKETKEVNKEVKETEKIPANIEKTIGSGISKLEIDKINARIEIINNLLKTFNERFEIINQRLGELRAMSLANEKSILKSTQEAARAVDIVKEVKPEKLRLDYQRLELKFNTLSEKLEANRQFIETVMSEVKDLRRKAGIFIGTDALLKLNEDVKKDLIELKKMAARVQLNADKSEQIFIEIKKGFTETQKINEIIANLDTSYSGIKKEIEKLKLDYSNIVKRKDFDDLMKTLNNKFSIIENSLLELEKIKENNKRLSQLIEETLLIARKNKEDIADIAMTIGNSKIKRVSDYENQLNSTLKIIDKLASQVSFIKRKIGMKSAKIKKIPKSTKPHSTTSKKISKTRKLKTKHKKHSKK